MRLTAKDAREIVENKYQSTAEEVRDEIDSLISELSHSGQHELLFNMSSVSNVVKLIVASMLTSDGYGVECKGDIHRIAW